MGNWVNQSARLALGLCAGAMLAWLLVLGPLQYPAQASHTPPLLPQLAFLVLLPCAAAVMATLSLATARGGSSMMREPAWTSRLIYPRRFWLWLCSGLTASDLLLVACWAAANACWFAAIYSHRSSRLLAKHAKGTAGPPPAAMIKMLAKCLGGLLFPNLALLFMPVARGSPLLQAAHISYPAAIRYHRWLGRFVVLLVLTHGLTYMGVWGIAEGAWARKTFEQAPDNNHLAGFVGLLAAALLLLSSLEVVRRRHWPVFKALHHAGFWTFLVAGCCHEWRIFWYFLPGLALYAIDGVLRLQQAFAPAAKQPAADGAATHAATGTGSDSTKAGSERGFSSSSRKQQQQQQPRLLSASVSSDASVTCLVLQAPQCATCPSGFVWLCVPEISPVQFHPFDFLAVPLAAAAPAAADVEAAGGPAQPTAATAAGPALLLHIKAYNNWTRRLRDLVLQQEGRSFTVKIQGPFSEHPWPAFGSGTAAQAAGLQQLPDGTGAAGGPLAGVPGCVAIIAGGLGITSAFSALQELAAAAAAAAPMAPHPLAGLPVLLVWSSRSAAELELLAPRLMAMAHALKIDLTIKLYLSSGAAAPCNSRRTDACALAAQRLHVAGGAGAPNNTGGGDMQMSSLCPVVALGSCVAQAGFRVLAHVLAFAGVVAAVFLVHSVAAVTAEEPWPVAYTGAAFVLTIAAFILLPGLGLLWAALWWQRRTHTATPRSSSNHPVAAAAAAVAAVVAAGSTAELQPVAAAPGAAGSAVLQLPDDLALLVHGGRPPVKQLLGSWLEAVQQAEQQQDKVSAGKDVAIELAAVHAVCGTSKDSQASSCSSSCSSNGSSSSSSSKSALWCRAFCMGPEPMLQQVQLLCDDMNAAGSSRQWWRRAGAAASSKQGDGLPTSLQQAPQNGCGCGGDAFGVFVECVRKTHSL